MHTHVFKILSFVGVTPFCVASFTAGEQDCNLVLQVCLRVAAM